jgi:hypothetical protein
VLMITLRETSRSRTGFLERASRGVRIRRGEAEEEEEEILYSSNTMDIRFKLSL